MAVETVPVGPSTLISAITYDPEKLELIVRFQNGWVYAYQQVDLLTVKGFGVYESPGKFFNQAVKGQFEYERLE